MRADIVVFFIHLALDVQVEDAFHACRLHRSGHSCQHRVGFDVREILVYQAVGCDDGFARHDRTFGEGGPVADPDVLTEDNGFGQRSNLPVAVEVLHIVERRVHELAVPSGAHIAANDNPVEAENFEVGAEINLPFTELQRRVVGNDHIGTMAEDDRSVEDDGTAHVPDALLDGGVHVMVVLPDPDHPGTDRSVDDDFPRQTAERDLPVQPNRQFLRHREGKHFEIEPEGFKYVDGSYDV